jgi:hypothetical protein
MVSEFKLVLTPVDAEMGRGAGQVQVLTKSGTNAYHGSALWSLMNTGIDANEWNLNRTHTIPNWRNANEYTLSASGPIIKNKTFFFVTWDQAIIRQKMTVRGPALTNCARKGIYRYFSGWIPGNTQYAVTTAALTNARPSTDANGNPLVPATNRDGTAYSGTGPVAAYPGLQFQSVLGKLSQTATNEFLADPVNCSQLPDLAANDPNNNGITAGSNWDPYRKAFDTSGYTQRFTALMPKANDFYGGGLGAWGDGLNVADLRWTRTTPGQDTVYGTGEDNQRKSFTVKLDHNVSAKNRLSGTFSYENDDATAAENSWPNPASYGGTTARKPITFTGNFTSTLRPTLLNEFRVGLAYNASHNLEPTSGNNSAKEKALLQQLMPTSSWSNWNGLPVVIGPGSGYAFFGPDTFSAGLAYPFQSTFPTGPYGSRGDLEGAWGDHDYRWTFNDTMTWTKGAHSFRGGAEYRLTHSNQDFNGWAQFYYSSNTFPYVQGGEQSGISAIWPTGLSSWAGMTGFNNFLGWDNTGTYAGGYELMDYMAGTVGTIRQYYFANSATATTWNNPSTGQTTRNLNMIQNEMDLFFKDDWKVSSSLTLNLGVRWDYYGVPWVANGLSVGLVGGGQSIFGGSTGGFSTWLQNPAFNANNLTTQQFIGPGSPNPGQSAYNKDLNNFGPAIGFAWQLPWFGKGKTTLRGGYQASFIPIASSDPNGGYGAVIGNVPGTIYPESFSGDASWVNHGYLDLSTLQQLVPVGNIVTNGKTISNAQLPLQVQQISTRSQAMSVYDPNIKDPYIESLTLALTRNVGSNMTVDVRYIGTFSRKQIGTLALDSANWINNGLLNAFNIARAGGESPLLNQLILPGTLSAGVTSGAAQLRANQGSALAQGAFASLASTLGNANGTLPLSSLVKGGVLRNSGTPENFIFTNPQLTGAGWISNLDNDNYHSLQAQFTLRPTHNLNFQATYTFSRNLGYMGSGTNPLNRGLDYGLLSSSRKHNLTTYGTYSLPFGTNGYLFRDSSKAVKRVVEGWQLSWISYVYSGIPGTVSDGTSSMWGGPSVNLVRPDLFNPTSGHVTWARNAPYGYYFGSNKYMQVPDPQCSNTSVVAASLASSCNTSIKALAVISGYDSNGNPIAGPIVMDHALPGTMGNMDTDTFVGQGRWGLDMTAGKNIMITEGKNLNIRIDAQNVFNHPTPSGTAPYSYNNRDYATGNPSFSISSTTTAFGLVPYKGGHRVFSAKVRFTF